MKTRLFNLYIILFAAIAWPSAEAAKRPNIVLIFSDDQRPVAFTALGNTVASVGVLAGRAASGAAGGDLKLPDVKLPGGLPKLPDLPGLPGQKKGPPSGFDE